MKPPNNCLSGGLQFNIICTFTAHSGMFERAIHIDFCCHPYRGKLSFAIRKVVIRYKESCHSLPMTNRFVANSDAIRCLRVASMYLSFSEKYSFCSVR